MMELSLYTSYKKSPYSYCTKKRKVSEWSMISLAFPVLVKYNNYLVKVPASLQHFSENDPILPSYRTKES